MEDSFIYRSFNLDLDRRTVRFSYAINHGGETHELTEVLKFPLDIELHDGMQSALRALHLGLGISYYKIFVSPKIEHPYKMSGSEANFWNNVFTNGLGEFLYVNRLSKDKIAKFSQTDGMEFPSGDDWQPKERAMLGIGGGKDSIVAGELLKTLGVELDGFVMATGEQLGQTKSVTEVMDIGLSPVERTLDKQLLELQEREGAYKGHVPISLIFGLVGTVLALAQDAAYVVVANENSASIPRAEWEGGAVNHQWSKSYEFEIEFQAFLRENVAVNLTYFSAIRPLSSVAVGRLFVRYPQYFEVFTSDNSVFRIDPAKRPNGRWGLESPKSLSSFILLGAWMSQTDLQRTFGRDFLDEQELQQLFDECVGLSGHQPLDCVGTVEELVLSLNLMYKAGKCTESFLMKRALEQGLIQDKDWQDELNGMLAPMQEEAFPNKLKNHLNQLFAPRYWQLEQFKGKDIVFVGAGRGRAMAGVKQFLQNEAEIASFVGVDKQDGDEPLDFLKSYDQTKTLFIKNEGIPGTEMPVPYMTQLQLFFDLVGQTGATTVGITGTKGKTTTASLTAHVLEQSGRDVILAGNIGVSPLNGLQFAGPQTVFVLELSSYQLSDLNRSPHISACINLYNDHTDWHGSLEDYWEAKHNIMRFADSDDIFFYNPDFPALQDWADNASCKTVAIDPGTEFDLEGAKLYGEHNRLNALFARAIALEFGADEEAIKKAVDSFEPVEHRMEFVAVKDNRTYINDAIGMTPESTIASLRAIYQKFGQIGCLLLGGQDRNYDFSELMELVAKYNVPYLVMFPETEDKMQAALPADYKPEIFKTKSMDEAVKYARDHSPLNSVVLLSTAAPSYLLWSGFEEKGTKFKEAVSNL